MPLRRRKPVKPTRLSKVLRASLSGVMQCGESILRCSMTLRRRELRKPTRLSTVLRPALSPSELELLGERARRSLWRSQLRSL